MGPIPPGLSLWWIFTFNSSEIGTCYIYLMELSRETRELNREGSRKLVREWTHLFPEYFIFLLKNTIFHDLLEYIRSILTPCYLFGEYPSNYTRKESRPLSHCLQIILGSPPCHVHVNITPSLLTSLLCKLG